MPCGCVAMFIAQIVAGHFEGLMERQSGRTKHPRVSGWGNLNWVVFKATFGMAQDMAMVWTTKIVYISYNDDSNNGG